MSSFSVRPDSPKVQATLLAVPKGNIASGVELPINRLATLPTVPSPPATTTMSPGFFKILCHFFSFDD
jgi:hypothetical protein